MDTEFWNQRWEKNKIAFHESQPNSLLVANFKALKLVQGSRVFLPLCGKTLDIYWLLSKGYQVVGIELSVLAIEQLFTELGVEPKKSDLGNVICYSALNIDIFQGDFFDLSSESLGTVDAVYDRAALVALPDQMRTRYSRHLLGITDTSKQLLITFEYDQSQMDGPPFSLSNDEVTRHYEPAYHLVLLNSIPVPGGLKGKCEATENIWLLHQK